MTERPIVFAAPLVTLGDPAAEVCVDGWCGPVDRLDADIDQRAEVGDGSDPADGVVRIGDQLRSDVDGVQSGGPGAVDVVDPAVTDHQHLVRREP